MAMSERDDKVAAAYGAAATALDERPSEATRAAILAAAAREVGARPTAANAPGASIPGARRYPLPLAAAATVLIGTVAVLLATRTEREMPAEEVARPSTLAAAPAATDARQEAPREAPPESAKAPAIAQSEAKPAAPPPAQQTPRTVPERARQQESGGRRAAQSAQRASAPGDSAQVTADAAATSDAARTAAAGVAAPLAKSEADASESVRSEPAISELRRDQPVAAAPAAPEEEHVVGRPVARTKPFADGVARPARQESAQAWIERIVKLRAAGRDAEADEEVKKFRAQYPQATLPEAALRR
jgi:hypothetical protein